jgi:hypothetical protein
VEFEAPVSVHTHSAGWCSVIGGRVYRGQAFPRLYGRYIYTDYCPTPYYSLVPNGSGGFLREEILTSNGGVGTACIAENSALELFVSNVNTGTVKRIVDQCPMEAPVIVQNSGIITSTPADTYAWYFEGELIAGANTQSITFVELGTYYVVAGFNGVCSFQSAPLQVIESGLRQHEGTSFVVFPIPARDVMSLKGLPSEAIQVRVTDITGRTMFTNSLNGKDTFTLDVSGLSNANYMVALLTSDGTVLQQRMVQVQR